MKKIVITIIFLFLLNGCSKMEEKKASEENKTSSKENTNVPKTETNTPGELKSQGQTDEKATELAKEAEASLAKYNTDKSDANKKTAVTSLMAAANYLMFDANLPAREKYRPALKYYRKILELDPKNEEATKNKKQIEDIYESMGMPIPQ